MGMEICGVVIFSIYLFSPELKDAFEFGIRVYNGCRSTKQIKLPQADDYAQIMPEANAKPGRLEERVGKL